jgi:hypothetical protein
MSSRELVSQLKWLENDSKNNRNIDLYSKAINASNDFIESIPLRVERDPTLTDRELVEALSEFGIKSNHRNLCWITGIANGEIAKLHPELADPALNAMKRMIKDAYNDPVLVNGINFVLGDAADHITAFIETYPRAPDEELTRIVVSAPGYRIEDQPELLFTLDGLLRTIVEAKPELAKVALETADEVEKDAKANNKQEVLDGLKKYREAISNALELISKRSEEKVELKDASEKPNETGPHIPNATAFVGNMLKRVLGKKEP